MKNGLGLFFFVIFIPAYKLQGMCDLKAKRSSISFEMIDKYYLHSKSGLLISPGVLERRCGRRDLRGTCAVLTISDTRTKETDTAGKKAIELLTQANFDVVDYNLIKNDKPAIKDQLEHWINQEIQIILTIGGTGISKRDTTPEVVREFLGKVMDGYATLQSVITYFEWINIVPILGVLGFPSRAIGGVTHNEKTLIFAMSQSVNAVTTILTKILIPELPFLLGQLQSPE